MSVKSLLTMALVAMTALSCVEARETKKDDKTEPVEPVDPIVPIDDDVPEVDPWQKAKDVNTVVRSTWQGVIDGMYMGKADSITLDDECFGDWMIDDTKQITDFFGNVFSGNLLNIAYEDAMDSAYDIVDLMFMTIEYCKFREVVYGWIVFFKTAEVFGANFWKRVEGKAFDFISQITALTETFTDLSKGETVQQISQASYTISKGITKIFVDFIGF
jgi:hypothetical protein